MSSPLKYISVPLVGTVLFWGFNFVAVKLIYQQMEAPALALTRFLAMYLLLLAWCWARKEPLRYTREDSLKLIYQGFLSMGLYMVLFLEGMTGSSAAEGAIILAVAPILTAFFAAAAKQEKLTVVSLGGAAIAFTGVALVATGGTHVDHGKLLSNWIVLASAVVWAYSAVYSKPLLTRYSATQMLTLSMPGAFLILIPYGLVSALRTDWRAFTPTTWGMFAHIVFLAGFAGFLGFYAGVRKVGAAGALLYQYFVPPIAALTGFLLMGQALTTAQVVGMLIVFAGVSVSSVGRFIANRVPQTT